MQAALFPSLEQAHVLQSTLKNAPGVHKFSAVSVHFKLLSNTLQDLCIKVY